MEDHMRSSDLHNDGTTVVSAGDDGVVMWNSNTSQEIKKVRVGTEHVIFVRILYDPQRLLCVDYDYEWGVYVINIINFNGEELQSFIGVHYPRSLTLLDNSRVVSGNMMDKSVQITDLLTGETLYKFHHHSSEGFSCFAFHKQTQTLFCGNNNKRLYVLKTTPN